MRASQLPPTSSAITRKSRGIAPKKMRAQLDMKSQQKAKAALKQANAKAKTAAKERKVTKTLKPRKDDVLQMTDDFLELKSLP